MSDRNSWSTLKIVTVFSIIFFIISLGILTISTQDRVEFEKIGYYRNDEPPVRIRTYYTSTKNFEIIKEHAKNLPWDKGGIIQVYYFDDKEYTPNVDRLSFSFEHQYKKHCLALYRKLTRGEELFEKYPYRD